MHLKIIIGEHQELIETKKGENLLAVLRKAGHQVESPCGGIGKCGKCKVNVSGIGNVLSCQTKLDAALWDKAGVAADQPLAVHLPLAMAAHISTEGLLPDIKLHPLAGLKHATLPAASLEDQRPFDQRFFETTGFTVPLPLLKDLPDSWLGDAAEVSYLVRHDIKQVIAFWHSSQPTGAAQAGATPSAAPDGEDQPALPDAEPLGIAVDIGTTTLGSWLYGLQSGERLATAARLNPQRTFGADVISRIDEATKNPEHRQTMRKQVLDAISQLITELISKASAARQSGAMQPEHVAHVVLTGNTTMLHLLTGLTAASIARTPFMPVSTREQMLTASSVGLDLPAETIVQLMPGIASYVGADITAGLLACDLDKPEKDVRVLLDIGTNGEIVLAGPEGLIACSTAAGPAFEGANISCGLGGVVGAVDDVWWKGETLCTSVIDPQGEPVSNGSEKNKREDKDCGADLVYKPRGLCGSGLIAAIAACLEKGLIDETGRIEDDLDELPENLRQYIAEIDGQDVILLVAPEKGEKGNPVYLTQKDIREVQNAKAAMAAGIQLLIQQAGITPEQVKALYLAGGFGQHLKPEHAFTIGLLPEELRGRTQAVGNTAGMGAILCLLDTQQSEKARKIAKQVHYYELSADKRFTDLYVEAMMFPE